MTKVHSGARGGVPDLADRRETLDTGFLVWLREHRWWVLGFLVLFYAAAFNGQWRISDDSGWYVYWAHGIAAGAEGVREGVPPHFYPGLPWLLAGMFEVFGTDRLLAAQIVMLGLGAAGLGLTYGLARRFAGAEVAWVVTLLVGVNHTYFEQGYRLLSDLPFAVGVLLLLYGYERAQREGSSGAGEPPARSASGLGRAGLWLLAAAGGVVLMMTMRRAGWLVLAAVGLGVCLQLIRGGGGARRWWMAAGLLAVAGLGAGLFLLIDPRGSGGGSGAGAEVYATDFTPWGGMGLDPLTESIFIDSIPKFLSEVAPTVSYGLELGPGLDLVFGLVPIIAAITVLLGRGRVLWAVLVGVYVAVCAVKSPTPRYFLPVIPFLAMGWWYFTAGLSRRCPPHVGPYVFWFGLALWVAPNMVKNVDLIVEQRRTPFLEHYKEGQYAGIADLGRWVREHLDPDDVLFSEYPAPLTHFAQRRDIEKLARLTDITRASPRFLQWFSLAPAAAGGSLELERLPGPQWRIGGMSDFTGDDQPDILWRNRATGENIVWRMDGTTKVGVIELKTVDPSWEIGGVADFTGDGRPDILWRNSRSYQNTIWHMEGTTHTASTNPGGSGAEYRIEGAADFTGDGQPDILWHDDQTGQTGAWPMNGPKQRLWEDGRGGWFTLPPATGRDWRIGGAISFPGEAGDHILWRNRETGENRIWLVEGRRKLDAIDLPPLDPEWRAGGLVDLDGDGATDILWRNPRTGRNMLWRGHSEVYVAIIQKMPSGALSAAEERAAEVGPVYETIGRGLSAPPWTLRRVPISGADPEN